MKKRKYEKVKYIFGQDLKHYCTNDAAEYLAETSKEFFSSSFFRNDYFPFIHLELKEFDPEGYEMIKRVFKLDNEWVKNYIKNLKTPIDYDPKKKSWKSVTKKADPEKGFIL